MEWKDRVIQEVYSGNETRYEREYPLLIDEARADVISWEDLNRSAFVLPHLKEEGKKAIEYYLGYLPEESVTMEFEPFLRSLIQQKNSQLISYKEYSKLAEEHIRLIRNEDVKFNLMDDYDVDLYEIYYENYDSYGAVAKQRLVNMLGYEPDLKHSLLAELYLRKILEQNTIKLPRQMTSIDYKAITVIRYRQVLLIKGKKAADDWPVLNCEPDWVHKNPPAPPFG